LLNYQNYHVGRSSIISNVVKNFDVLAISLSILHNYFDGSNRIIFKSVSSRIFRYFNKIILSV